jgi:hypothetical protein
LPKMQFSKQKKYKNTRYKQEVQILFWSIDGWAHPDSARRLASRCNRIDLRNCYRRFVRSGLVETAASPSKLASQLAGCGTVVLTVAPRGLPRKDDNGPFSGDWLANTRAWLIGRNLPGKACLRHKLRCDSAYSPP